MDKFGANVDKKVLLSSGLAYFMNRSKAGIEKLVERYPRASIQFKQDGSPVTDLDLYLSSHIELLIEHYRPDVTFYSEENYSDWCFPLLALDPLDGTREYIEGRNEWAISLGLFESNQFLGEGWIFNPMTNEVFDRPARVAFQTKDQYCGEVSRSEWKDELFKQYQNSKFIYKPVGSIAYKLARLAYGQSDFVVSLKPKNIWDIAGGTLLAQSAGLKFYSQGKEVTSVEKLYLPPLIWGPSELMGDLLKIFS